MFDAELVMNEKKNPYTAFDQFVLRTPILAFEFYRTLTSQSSIEKEVLKKTLNQGIIKEAIFLASPTLYFELEKWSRGDLEKKKEQRVIFSLLKYLSRMSARCTPFGLFAGCTLGHFSDATDLKIERPKNHQRHTRPDMNYLVALSQDLSRLEHIKKQLTYFPNSSLYQSGSRLRYIEYYYVNSRRYHQIVEIDHSPYLQEVLIAAANGASLEVLANVLTGDSISFEEASGFLDELLESQVLTSNLEPSVSGPPFVDQMLAILNTLDGCDAEIQMLQEISKRFEGFDQKLGNEPDQYLALSTFLKGQKTAFELKYLFQTDLEPKATSCTLSKQVLFATKKAMALFNQITPVNAENNLSRFKEAFQERYEEREMPLSKVLDVELGIGYLQNTGGGDINPLVDDLFIPPDEDTFNQQNTKLNRIHGILSKKIIAAQKTKKLKIKLEDSDFEGLSVNWENLPDTLSGLIELIQDKEQTKVVISGFGGSSAANLLGRFCHKESALSEYTHKIVGKETEMESDRILAEIVHLPEARVGNILMRPSFREYEIAYMAKSILPKEQQISLDDLFISVKGNRIHLRSKKHNKEVLPRLTNAHNFSANSLPIYHFLCDLQTQGLRAGIGFNFGPLDALFDFLPRVEYDNLILHSARWRLRKEVTHKLLDLKTDGKELLSAIKQLQKEQGIPQFVMLVDGDNELLINLHNTTSALMLLETVKNRTEFILKEFLHHGHGTVFSEKGYHTNQMVISFFNTRKMKHNRVLNKISNGTT